MRAICSAQVLFNGAWIDSAAAPPGETCGDTVRTLIPVVRGSLVAGTRPFPPAPMMTGARRGRGVSVGGRVGENVTVPSAPASPDALLSPPSTHL